MEEKYMKDASVKTTKPTKSKKKSKYKIYNFPWKYLIYGLTIAFFVAVLIVEIFYLKKVEINNCNPPHSHVKHLYDDFCCRVEDKFYVNNIISIICPVAATALSISISLYSDMIYGVPLSVFRSYIKHRFSLEEMIIIPLVILALCVVLYYFSMFITTIVLNFIALFYVIYFLFTELRLMTKNKHQRTRILKRVFAAYDAYDDNGNDLISIVYGNDNSRKKENKKNKKKSKNNNHSFESDRENAETILSNLIYENDLVQAYDRLNLHDARSFSKLLTLSTNHVSQNIVLKETNPVEFENIKHRHINNVKSYLMRLPDIHMKDDDFDVCNSSIINSIDVIQQNCTEKELTETYLQELSFISCLLYPRKDYVEKNNICDRCLLNVSNSVLTNSVKSQSLWYSKNLFNTFRLGNLDHTFKDEKYFIFSSIYIFYYSCGPIDSNFKNDIIRLLSNDNYDSRMQNPVFSTLWNYYGRGFDKYLELLKSLLAFYKGSKNLSTYWFISGSNGSGNYFTPEYLIKWWVAFLFLGACKIPNDFEQQISEILDDNELCDLANSIYSYKSKDDKTFDDIMKYFKYIGLSDGKRMDLNYVEAVFMPNLKSFVDKRVPHANEKSQTDNLKQDDIYNEILDDINKSIKSCPFYSTSISLTQEDEIKKIKYFGTTDTQSIKNFATNYDSEIRRLIFEDYVNRPSSKNDSNFDLVQKVTFGFTNDSSGIYQTGDGKMYKFNLGSIMVNFEITTDSYCCNLSDAEIDNMINRDYTQKDGLYAYKVPTDKNLDSEILYVTKDRLIGLIKENYKKLNLFIKYKIILDTEKMFTELPSNQDDNSNNSSLERGGKKSQIEKSKKQNNKNVKQCSQKSTSNPKQADSLEIETSKDKTTNATKKEDTSKKK